MRVQSSIFELLLARAGLAPAQASTRVASRQATPVQASRRKCSRTVKPVPPPRRLPDARLLDHPVLDLLRVTAILSRDRLEHPRLEPVLERGGFHVYRRTGAPPMIPLATNIPPSPAFVR